MPPRKNQIASDFGHDPARIRAFSYRGRNAAHADSGRHAHGFHQLLFVSAGFLLFADEQRAQPLYAPLAALIPAGWSHRTSALGEVVFDSLYLRPGLLKTPPEIRIFSFSDLARALLVRLCERPLAPIETGGFENDALRLLLRLVRAEMCRPAELPRLPVPTDERVRRLTDFIDRHHARKITPADLRSELPLSTRQISRLFQAELGLSVGEYLRLVRLTRAALLLAGSDRPIADIAYSCGFESLSVFYEGFRTTFGRPPAAFRRQGRFF